MAPDGGVEGKKCKGQQVQMAFMQIKRVSNDPQKKRRRTISQKMRKKTTMSKGIGKNS